MVLIKDGDRDRWLCDRTRTRDCGSANIDYKDYNTPPQVLFTGTLSFVIE